MAIYEKAKTELEVTTNAKDAAKELDVLNKKLKELNLQRKAASEQNDYIYNSRNLKRQLAQIRQQ